MSEDIFFEVGQRIAAVRGNLTQAEFATRLGVNRNTVSRWESGERLPDGSGLLGMAAQFGVDITYILTGTTSTGAVPTLPPDEAALLDNYRNSPADGRERLRQISVTAAQSAKRRPKAA